MAMFFLFQRTMSEIQIESLRKHLVEANLLQSTNSVNLNGDKNVSFRESEAILVIKRLQEQVLLLFLCFFFSPKLLFDYKFFFKRQETSRMSFMHIL